MLTTDFCIEVVQEAIAKHDKPDIFNTDQGCQFNRLLRDNGIQISMDGKGCWRDNVFGNDCERAANTKKSICTPTTA